MTAIPLALNYFKFDFPRGSSQEKQKMFLVFLREMQLITKVDALQMVLHIKHIYRYKNIYRLLHIYTHKYI